MGALLAILNVDGTPVDAGLLRSLLDLPAFDPACALWTDGAIGLAYAPLRARHSAQCSHGSLLVDDRRAIIFDGRLDDRATLSGRLEIDRDRAPADIDLIAAAYARWGDACPRHLLGDFAFCVWDRDRRQLLAARDHFGIKPLYLARRGNTVVVSDVLRSVQRHPAVSGRLDDQAIGDFLLFGLGMDPQRTSFADIGRVPPGHVAICPAAAQTHRLQRYWSFEPGENEARLNECDVIDRFAELFRNAVADRVRGGPVGIFMSGGLDSSSIAAIAADVLGATASSALRAFTGVYDAVEDEERYYSSIVAATLNIRIDYTSLDAYTLFQRWDGGEAPPEPSSEPLTAITADLLDRAALHAPVVLTGDGGDPLQLPSPLIAQLGRVPFVTLMTGFCRSLASGAHPPVGLRSGLRRWLRPAAGAVPAWLAEPLKKSFDARARWNEVTAQRLMDRGPRSHAVNGILDPWWPSTFEAYDPGSTGRPASVRYPFFDVRLASFAARLPSFPWCVNKHVLRSAMRGRLPDVIRLRPKAPLAVTPSVMHGQWSMQDAVRTIEAAAPGIEQYVDVKKFESMVRSDVLFTNDARGSLEAVSLAMWLRHSTTGAAIA